MLIICVYINVLRQCCGVSRKLDVVRNHRLCMEVTKRRFRVFWFLDFYGFIGSTYRVSCDQPGAINVVQRCRFQRGRQVTGEQWGNRGANRIRENRLWRSIG